MRNYFIKKVEKKEFDLFLICLTFESFMTYIEEIEKSPEIKNQTGKVLIDQLLVTGNSENRFVDCMFKNGKLDITTACVAKPKEYFRKTTSDILKENNEYVKHSILTEKQRRSILDGECI